MKDLLKNMFRMELTVSIIYLLIGAILFFLSATALKTISIFLGIIAIIIGIFPIISYFKSQSRLFGLTNLLTGITFTIAGLVMIMYPSLLETVIAIMVGVIMIVNGINKIEYAVTLKEHGVKEWNISMAFAIITLLIGIFFVIKTWTIINIVTKVLGLIIMIYALIDLAETIFIRRKVKYVVSTTVENGKEVRVIDEK